MCRSKMATNAAQPGLIPQISRPRRLFSRPTPAQPSHASAADSYSTGSSYTADTSRTTTSVSSRTSLSSIQRSLPENTCIYDFSEIRSATNNFLARRYSSSSSHSWRCTLRGKDVIVFQRKFRRSIQTSELKERLSVICRSHHMSIIKLLGAAMSGDHVYLVHDFVKGANLSDCLRNPRNPNFTVLDTWMSRMQIATDLSHGLDYIHNHTGLTVNLVHKNIKSSSIIVTEPSFNAKICHFGTAVLCGETAIERKEAEIFGRNSSDEIVAEADASESPSQSKRSDNRVMQFEGVRGYMSPEFQSTGVATQKSDVFSFGVVILELLTGEEPLKYRFDKTNGDYKKISVIETARDVIEGRGAASGGCCGDGEGVEGRLRRWVDRRLRDSFPVEVAEKMARIALACVHENEDERPSMRRVAGKISKLYLESRVWLDKVRVPTAFSVSFAPR